jgi:hypothetical protein
MGVTPLRAGTGACRDAATGFPTGHSDYVHALRSSLGHW